MRVRTHEAQTEKDLNRIEGKVDKLTKLIQETIDQSREMASQGINRLLTRTGARMEEAKRGVRERPSEAANRISRLMGESGSRLQATREAMMERADDAVAEHPWRASLVALLVGIVLGMVLSPARGQRA
ncbi:MAG: hypothetical protein GX552_11090 [Chloroflexi bacterium]|nr:hypothetical protein [Chloroflexota bacterium]